MRRRLQSATAEFSHIQEWASSVGPHISSLVGAHLGVITDWAAQWFIASLVRIFGISCFHNYEQVHQMSLFV